MLFELDEYKHRVKSVQAKMHAMDMNVLVVSHPANMFYLSGFTSWSFYVHQGLILHKDADAPIWFGRAQDSNAARLYCWIGEENIRGYPDHYVMSSTCHPMEYAADIIKEKGWDRGRIGVETDGYYFTARGYFALGKSLPNCTLIDDGLIVNLCRRVKSLKEIQYIREAAQIAGNTMLTAIDTIKVGVRENDAAGEVYKAQIAGVNGLGGDYTALCPIMPSAERTSSAHLTWCNDRSYQKGDIVLLELAGARHHYHCPISRTLYVGEPDDQFRRIADVVINGLSRTLEHIRPGVTAAEVEEYWRGCLKGTGVEKPSRVGYSFGAAFPPDWGEQNLSLRPDDKTPLEPGMCIHFMPGIWLDNYGFECSEPFLVTENGCECFMDIERKLFSKI